MLKINNIFIGKVLIKLPEINSSSDFLQKLASEKSLEEGTVVQASFQTAGKGQRSNIWESKAGENLLVSFFLKPDFLPAQHAFFLNIISSLALKDTIEAFIPQKAQIKWPNDLWVEEKKMGGILITNTLKKEKINTCIVGIGLNVNQTTFSPSAGTPSSLKLMSNESYSLDIIRNSLCENLEKWYLDLKAGKVEKLTLAYRTHLLGLNEKRAYKDMSNGEVFQGEIRGVNAIGQLLIKKENGTIKYYNNKEVAFIKK